MKIRKLNEDIQHCWFGYYFDIKGNKKYFYMTKDSTSKDPDEASDIMEDSIPEPFTKFVFQGSVANTQAEKQGWKLVECKSIKESIDTNNIEAVANANDSKVIYYNTWNELLKERDALCKSHIRMLKDGSFVSVIYRQMSADICWPFDERTADSLEKLFERYPRYKGLDVCVAKELLDTNTPPNESLSEGIEVETIGDYITDHYDFDDIDDKYSCINSIRDSFKDERTISKEELEQFIGSHNGKDKVNESATHCVYFTQDGMDQIEFEGSEDECNRYISDIQAEQDDEFGDEAPERFIKRLHEQVFTLNESLFREDFDDDKYTASRYLDMELPDICDKVLEMLDVLPSHKAAYITKICRDFYAKLESIITSYTMTNESLHEDVTDVVTDTLAGPAEGPESGLASLLNTAVQDEFKTIQMYNDIAVSARAEGFEDIATVVDEINTEENKHVGQLQELLKTVSPNAKAIDTGEIEGQQQIGEVTDIVEEDLNNSNSSPNNNTEEDDKDMKESWEEVYQSFKTIEKELNGDGEAITATIDQLYRDNKGNPDYEKAYKKWAAGE